MTKALLFRLVLRVVLLWMCPTAASVAQQAAAPAPTEATPPGANSFWRLDLEYQPADVFENTVQRPDSSDGTRFGVTSFGGPVVNTGRISVYAPLNLFRAGDELRLLYAPFRQSGTGLAAQPLNFDHATFQPGVPLKVLYRFDTYRLTYDLPVFSELRGNGWELRAGATVALRDARIQLSQPLLTRNHTNLGPIPFLLYGSATKELAPGWHALGEFDAFPAPGGGGLFDGSLKVAYDVTSNVSPTAGYRYEIGGATEKTIYTLLSAGGVVVGLNLRFQRQ